MRLVLSRRERWLEVNSIIRVESLFDPEFNFWFILHEQTENLHV